MAWIESHQEIGRHPKTRKLARELGVSVPAAVGHLHLLWHWVMDFAEDGCLTRYDAQEIADAAMWDGDADAFCNALAFARFIDVDNNCQRIHDWETYFGRLIAQRKANAERQRRYREREKRDEPITDDVSNADVTVTSPSRNAATVPNRTVQNSTEPNRGNTSFVDKSAENDKTTNVENGAKAPSRQSAPNYSDAFSTFWNLYPKGNGSKKRAWDVWQRLKPDDDTYTAIIDGVTRWNASERWHNGFVKAAERWLRDRGWEDDPPPPRNGTTPNGRASPEDRRRAAFAEARADLLGPDWDHDDAIETTGRVQP